MPDQRIIAHDDPTTDVFPASFGQTRLWFLQRYDPEGTVYNSSLTLRLRGSLDRGSLAGALGDLVTRHEALRTTFVQKAGELLQRIHPPAAVRLPMVEAADEAEAKRLADEAVRHPFDLERGPVLRPLLIRLRDADHILVIAVHHICTDGWSFGILLRELGESYGCRIEGREPHWDEIEFQYADFSVWQREALEDERSRSLAAWWREYLDGAPGILQLPTDRARPPVVSYRGDAVRFGIDAATVSALGEVGRRAGATPFMTFLAAFFVLLHRWTGENDLVVGTPVAGRPLAGVEATVGFFVNTLPVRLAWDADPTFSELLEAVRESALSAFAHQELPFERLVDDLRPERDPSHTPLVQVALALQNSIAEPFRLPGVDVEPFEMPDGSVPFELTLELYEDEDDWSGRVAYSVALFERDTIERFVRSFQVLLADLAAAPQRRISEFRVLDADERELVLERWNRTDAQVPDACAHELIEQIARTHPDSPALAGDGRAWTYAELDAEANRLAHHLRALGAGPERLVLVCGERRPELILAMVAILKAGAAYVPLDPTWPPERLAYVVDDCRPPAVCTTRSVADRFPDGVNVLLLDGDGAEWMDAPSSPPAGGVRPDNIAYTIYTSGSTGMPKGVMVEHRNVVNLAAWHARRFGLQPGDGVGHTAGAGFDASVFEIWGCLCNGAALHVPDDQTRARPSVLRDWIVEQQLTLCFLPTLVCERFLDVADWPPGTPLRYLVCGGAKLTRRPHPALRFEVHDIYGPTECTVLATVAHVLPDPQASGPPPIGGPMDNTRVYVVDPHFEPVPSGVVGELCISGAAMGRGYLGRLDLTAAGFVPDPFSTEPGSRMYRTGDLARWLPDGQLEMLGRIDDQVKVRGVRVELGEIEALLRDLPAVREAAVTVRGPRGDERLVAYVVPSDTSLEERRVREELRRLLPEYMVPSSFLMLDEFPTTSSGKLDRAALPEPAPATGDLIAPRTATEREIADVWCRVLGMDAVGIRDKFFDLGGTSMGVVELFEHLERRWPGVLSVADLFERATVEEMADAIDRAEVPVPHEPVEAVEL